MTGCGRVLPFADNSTLPDEERAMRHYRRGDCGHDTGVIGCGADRRQVELHRALAARCQDTLETEPQSGRVAGGGAHQGPAGRRLGLRAPRPNLWFHPQTVILHVQRISSKISSFGEMAFAASSRQHPRRVSRRPIHPPFRRPVWVGLY